MTDQNEAAEIVALTATGEASTQLTLIDELGQAGDVERQFEQYERAATAGVIDRLFQAIWKQGTPEQRSEEGEVYELRRWPIVRPGLNLELLALPTGAIVVEHNGTCILDDRDGSHLVFDPGQGLWLELTFAEAARLEREAKQRERLAERQKRAEQVAHDKRVI